MRLHHAWGRYLLKAACWKHTIQIFSAARHGAPRPALASAHKQQAEMPKTTGKPKKQEMHVAVAGAGASARPALKRTDTRRQLNKTAARTGRGLQKLANLSYERQWAKERKQAYAGEHIIHKVGFGNKPKTATNELECDCLICPCKHMS